MKTIGKIVAGREVFHLRAEMSIREAARYMTERRIGAAAVLDGTRLAGILSERDIMGRVVSKSLDPDATRVGDVMTKELVVIEAGESHDDGLRRMKQAGCRHLPVVTAGRLVAPGDWRSVECWRTAWGAQEVLEEARVFPSLDAALAGASYVAGLSGRREAGVASLDVREMAEQVAALSADDAAAIVFGPETSGLTLEELARCGRRVRIQSHPAQPSLNLSHAVMVSAYEVFRAGRRPVAGTRRATHAEKEQMLALLREGLRAVGAIPASNESRFFDAWRALFQRADLTPRELALLEHMARKMARARAEKTRDG